jgi:hypothetical protein
MTVPAVQYSDANAFRAIRDLLGSSDSQGVEGHQLSSVSVDTPERFWTVHCECAWHSQHANLALARRAFERHTLQQTKPALTLTDPLLLQE